MGEAKLDGRHVRTRVRSRVEEHVDSRTFDGLTYLELTFFNVQWLGGVSEMAIRRMACDLPSWRS
jgi:hypothetical protein